MWTIFSRRVAHISVIQCKGQLTTPNLFQLCTRHVLVMFTRQFTHAFSYGFTMVGLMVLRVLVLRGRAVPGGLRVLSCRTTGNETKGRVISINTTRRVHVFLSIQRRGQHFYNGHRVGLANRRFYAGFVVHERFTCVNVPRGQLALNGQRGIV